MTIRLIGDVHGKFSEYKAIIKNSPPSIQVGDMGVGFRRVSDGKWERNPPLSSMIASDARFIRGNHDNPYACSRHSQCIPDGTVESGVMFIGGAYSVDAPWRVEGFSWWPDEELSVDELADLIEVYAAAKPRVMVTHDAPAEICDAICFALHKRPAVRTRTALALQMMFSAHSPELWVFGHWHTSFDHIANGTRFVCLNELEYRDDLL